MISKLIGALTATQLASDVFAEQTTEQQLTRPSCAETPFCDRFR